MNDHERRTRVDAIALRLTTIGVLLEQVADEIRQIQYDADAILASLQDRLRS